MKIRIFIFLLFTYHSYSQECSQTILKSLILGNYKVGSLAKASKNQEDYTKTLEEVHDYLIDHYPSFDLYQEKISQIKIEPLPIVDKLSVKDIPFIQSDLLRPQSLKGHEGNKKIKQRFKELPEKFQKAYLEAYEVLHSQDKIREFLRDIYTETFYWQLTKSHKRKYLHKVEIGSISPTAVKTVLFQRAKRRGDKKIVRADKDYNIKGVKGDIPKDQNDRFRLAIRSGPFLDDFYDDLIYKEHGTIAHLIQRDFIDSVIRKHYGEDFNEFYEFLGSKDGVTFWLDLFDSQVKDSFTSPEYVHQLIYEKIYFPHLFSSELDL